MAHDPGDGLLDIVSRARQRAGDRIRGLLDNVIGGADRATQAVTAGNIAKLPGLLDSATRAITPEVGAQAFTEFTPEGDRRALARIPGLLEEGRQGEAALEAMSVIPVVGMLGDAARAARGVGRAAQEGQDLRRRFTDPIRAANEAGDTEEARRLTREMIQARSMPQGFSTSAEEIARQARAVEQDFLTEAFHGTAVRGPRLEQSALRSLNGREFNQFNWGTHAGSKQAANDRLEQLRPVRSGVTEVPGLPRLPVDTGPLADTGLFRQVQEGERIMPVRLRGKYLDIGEEAKEGVELWTPQSISEHAERLGVITAGEAASVLGPTRGFTDVHGQRDRLTALLEDKGFNGIKYTNTIEDAGSQSFMVFNPANIRSSMAARFDPENLGKADLLGAATPGGLLGAGAAAAAVGTAGLLAKDRD